MTFNVSSYSSSDLVRSARLLLSFKELASETAVRVSQVVAGGEIGLDSVTTGGEVLVPLDVSHGVAGWLAEPHTNLGLRLSLDTRTSWELQAAQLVLETGHARSVVRQKREVREQRRKCDGKCCRSDGETFN